MFELDTLDSGVSTADSVEVDTDLDTLSKTVGTTRTVDGITSYSSVGIEEGRSIVIEELGYIG